MTPTKASGSSFLGDYFPSVEHDGSFANYLSDPNHGDHERIPFAVLTAEKNLHRVPSCSERHASTGGYVTVVLSGPAAGAYTARFRPNPPSSHSLTAVKY